MKGINKAPNASLLRETRDKRRELFFKKLDESGLQLQPTVIEGILFDPVPVESVVNGIRDFRLLLPLNWRKRQYGFWYKKQIRLVRRNPNDWCYYLVDHSVVRDDEPDSRWKEIFMESTQFSLLYQAMYEWVIDLKKKYRVKLLDSVFEPLLDDLSDEMEPELTIHLILDKIEVPKSDNQLYIALFK